MSKTHDAVAQLEGALPTLFDRMLSVLGLMRVANQEVAALHSDESTDDIDSAAVLSQVANITSLSDQLASAITDAQTATTSAVQAVKADAALGAPAGGVSPAPAPGTAPAPSAGTVDPAAPVA